jgi:hypothetical protein
MFSKEGHQKFWWPRKEKTASYAKDAAHNPTTGSHSRSLIQVNQNAQPDECCSNSKAAGAWKPAALPFPHTM